MKIVQFTACGLVVACVCVAGWGLYAHAATPEKTSSVATKTAQSAVSTNDNGSVSRTFVESSVTTNGNLVTEKRRETRTTMDRSGNVLETSTSEYAQSYGVEDGPVVKGTTFSEKEKEVETDAFMGLTFGTVLNETNCVREAGEPSLVRVKVTPPKTLAGFDAYYAYLTPKSHKIAKICACAKEAVEPGNRRRHYLIEALEKRYATWARLVSFRRPYYAFDVAQDRTVTVCLADASRDYQTVISAWDETLIRLADEEQEALRKEAAQSAAKHRAEQVQKAVDSF